MAEYVTVKVKGLDELEKRMEQLAPKLAKRAMRKALRAAGKVLQDAQKERVPVDTGELRDDIRVYVKLSGTQEKGTVDVGPSENTNYIGRFHEFGTSKMPAKPWMRPAFDASADEALEAFVNVLRDVLPEIVEE